MRHNIGFMDELREEEGEHHYVKGRIHLNFVDDGMDIWIGSGTPSRALLEGQIIHSLFCIRLY